MPRKAKDLVAHAERIAKAWERRHPEKTFSGLTLTQFIEMIKPSREVRNELKNIASHKRLMLIRRRNADGTLRPVVHRVVYAVRGDPSVGESSAMYSDMGYVPPHRRRKPGRKRKRKSPA